MLNFLAQKKIYIAAILVIIIAISGLAYWYRADTSHKNYQAHIEKATQYEKQGENDEAIKELKEALKYIPPNDTSKKKEIEKKIATLKRKIEEEKEKETASSSQGGGGDTTGDNAKTDGGDSTSDTTTVIPGANVDVSKVRLVDLLPTSFEGLNSSPTAGSENIASVRFDDIGNDISYFVYASMLSSPKKAYDRAKLSVDMVFNKNVSELKLTGDFAGETGYYGENDLGDAILTFSYSSILYECLVTSGPLDTNGKRAKLLSLQKGVRKP